MKPTVGGLAAMTLVAVLGAVSPATAAGLPNEPIAERLTEVGSAISLGFGVSPLRWEIVPPPLTSATDVDVRSTAMSFDVKLTWPGAEASAVEPYLAFGPALFVVEPDYVSRLLGTHVDPTLRLGAKAGAGLNFRLGKDTTLFGAYEVTAPGPAGASPFGAKSASDSAIGGYDFTYGLRLRY